MITHISTPRRWLSLAPWDTPAGEHWTYGMATAIQLSPTEAGVFVNIHRGGDTPVDFEAGTDFAVVRHFDGPDGWRMQSLRHGGEMTDPETGKPGVLSSYPIRGGFVPLAARLPDGRPHPHAGTGFGLVKENLFDPEKKGMCEEDAYRQVIIQQYAYDGENFRVTGETTTPMGTAPLVGNWFWDRHFFQTAIPDGEDLLTTMRCRRGNAKLGYDGLCRWRRIDGRWQVVSFTPVTPLDETFEASLIRDRDGSLLPCARPAFRSLVVEIHYGWPRHLETSLWVWRSQDNGETWEQVIDIPDARSGTPVTINQALDGSPYILTNPRVHRCSQGYLRHKIAYRERLLAYPLTPDRHGVEAPLNVLDCNAQFGPPPEAYHDLGWPAMWKADLATGHNLRLADGRWHHIIFARGMLDLENISNHPPTERTGCYIAEVTTDGAAAAPWLFEDRRGLAN